MKKFVSITKAFLFIFGLFLKQNVPGQIHGLTRISSLSPGLVVCQNGKVGTFSGLCQSTISLGQSTFNCNGAIYTSSTFLTGNSTSTFLPLINNLQNIKQAATFNSLSGSSYNAALDNNGVLYTWGSNHKGQLGTGNTNSVVTPTPVLSNVKTIVNVKEGNLGNELMMVIKNDNSLWGWGSDEGGCMGTGIAGGFNPNPVQILTNVKKAVCSASTCVALKNDGTLWAWGNNKFSDLCSNCNYTQAILPPTKLDKITTFINDFDFVSDLFDLLLIAIDNNNKIYYSYKPGSSSFSSLKNLSFSNVNKVYSHGNNSYFLVNNNGEVYTFGNMNYYQGTQFSYYDTIPKKISFLSNIKELYTTTGKVYFLRNDGKLFFSGDNTAYQYEISSCGTSVSFVNTCELYLGCNILVGNKEYDLINDNLKLFPNPGKRILNVTLDSNEEVENITVTDISGKLIQVTAEKKSDNNYALDISQLSEGLYFASIKLKNHPPVSKKFMIER